MRNDTGESTASIKRRGDNDNWPRAKMALEQSGCILHRPSKLDTYHARNGNGQYVNGTSLSKTMIRHLEDAGEIIIAGVDTYILKRRFAREPDRWVLKLADGHHTTDDKIERFLLTNELCEKIAKENGSLNADEVAVALRKGQSVYNNFRRYVVEA